MSFFSAAYIRLRYTAAWRAGDIVRGGCGRVWEGLGEKFLAAGVRRVQSPSSVFLFTVLFTVTGFIPFF